MRQRWGWQRCRVSSEDLGPDWHSHFSEFDTDVAAAASLGQVYRAAWADGREVAVKVQYPGVASGLQADLTALGWALRAAGWSAGDGGRARRGGTAKQDRRRIGLSGGRAVPDRVPRGLDDDDDVLVPAVVLATPRVWSPNGWPGNRSQRWPTAPTTRPVRCSAPDSSGSRCRVLRELVNAAR